MLFYMFLQALKLLCAAPPIQRRRPTATATAEEYLARSNPPIPSRPGITYPVRAPALTPTIFPASADRSEGDYNAIC